jgi:hypothetical protein
MFFWTVFISIHSSQAGPALDDLLLGWSGLCAALARITKLLSLPGENPPAEKTICTDT